MANYVEKLQQLIEKTEDAIEVLRQKWQMELASLPKTSDPNLDEILADTVNNLREQTVLACKAQAYDAIRNTIFNVGP